MSHEEVTVTVGREGPNALEVSPRLLETSDPFAVVVENRGTPVHVHCKLTGGLADVARLERNNVYVEEGDELTVPIDVEPIGRDVEGTLEVSARYGATEVAIGVRIPAAGSDSVSVDQRLAEPNRPEPDPTALESVARSIGLEPGTLAVFALAVLAVILAVATAAAVGGTAAFLGVLAVGVGVVVAVWILLQ